MLQGRALSKVLIYCVAVLCSQDSICTNQILTLTQLESLKHEQNSPPEQYASKSECTHGNFLKDQLFPPLKNLRSNYSTVPHSPKPLCFETMFWWHLFPLTGLIFVPPHYPYLPHAFSLWQLAPSLGAEVKTTFIDTGVFGWDLTTKKGTFTSHPDLKIEGNFLKESCNCCPLSTQATDPFENLVTFIKSRTVEKDMNRIRQLLPLWIEEFLRYQTTQQLDNYLQTKGLPDIFIRPHFFSPKGDRKLSPEGKRVWKMLLDKEQGFGQFTLVTIESDTKAFLEFIPLPSVQAMPFLQPHPFVDHATHTTSIVGSRFAGSLFRTTDSISKSKISYRKSLMKEKGICGLAPLSSIHVIKALQEGLDTTDVTHISNAFSRATLYGSTIINLSLCIEEGNTHVDKRFAVLEKQCAQIPFLCCAAGNNGATKQGTLGYPARCKDVFFSVGSFGCSYNTKTQTYSCHISPFSQYEEGLGPHFIAPGEAILGCSSVLSKKNPLYALQTGTSHATAYLTGCLTLILGECKKDFSPQQIKIICQNSCFRLYDTIEWKKRVTYGVLDIRTALFTIHILKRLQKKFSQSFFDKHFLELVQAIMQELMELPKIYAQEKAFSISFKESFIEYYNKTRSFSLSATYKNQLDVSLEEALKSITHRILSKNHFLSLA